VIVLGRKTLFNTMGTPDIFKVGLFVVTLILLWKFKNLPEPLIVLASAVLGLICYPLLAHWIYRTGGVP
jgi:chromate transporter